jgi:hypothetical protein
MPNGEESLPLATGQSNLGVSKPKGGSAVIDGGGLWEKHPANAASAATSSAISISHGDFLLHRPNSLPLPTNFS